MPKIYTGLDIGTSSVKIVQLKRENREIELINFGIEEIPREGGDLERKALIVEAIKKIIREKKIKLLKVISSFSGKSVVIRNIQLPSMPEEELRDSVRYEAEQYMPFPPQETVLDFLVLDSITDRGAEKLEIAIVGTQKGILEEHLSLLKSAGLKLEAIEVVPFALRNSLLPEEERRVIALVDIGGGVTNISIFKNRILYFVRDIFIGGNNLTQAISESLKIDFKEGEGRKRKEGLESPQVSEILRPELDQLLIEIRRSFDYYLAQSREAGVDKVILSGGSARLKNIAQFFSENLGIETEISRPLKEVPELGPLLAVGAGLALSGYEEKRINLLPPKLRPRELRLEPLLKNKILVAVATFAVILLTVYLSLSLGMKNYTRKINLIKKGIVGLESAMSKVERIRREEKILKDKNRLLTQLIENRLLCSEVLKKMGEVIPEGVWLKELCLSKGEEGVNIKGSAFNNQLVAQYMLALENLPYFENVDLVFTNKGDLAVDFEIRADLK